LPTRIETEDDLRRLAIDLDVVASGLSGEPLFHEAFSGRPEPLDSLLSYLKAPALARAARQLYVLSKRARYDEAPDDDLREARKMLTTLRRGLVRLGPPSARKSKGAAKKRR
jgi:hypothetical protein